MSLLDAIKAGIAPSLDALTLLKQDHDEVSALLKEFEGLESRQRKRAIATQICNALAVHAQIEEEIFYPAARRAIERNDSDVLDEADVEHATIKGLVQRIQSGSTEDHFDAFVTVLGEYVKHHVKEEQGQLFPMVKKSRLDMRELGEQLMRRKQELMGGAAEQEME